MSTRSSIVYLLDKEDGVYQDFHIYHELNEDGAIYLNLSGMETIKECENDYSFKLPKWLSDKLIESLKDG